MGYGLRAGVGYAINPQLTLEGAISYEQLYYDKVVVREASGKNTTAPAKGTPLTDSNGNPIPFDLSGLRASVGLSFKF